MNYDRITSGLQEEALDFKSSGNFGSAAENEALREKLKVSKVMYEHTSRGTKKRLDRSMNKHSPNPTDPSSRDRDARDHLRRMLQVRRQRAEFERRPSLKEGGSKGVI